jgi:hypothetical protein
VALPLVYNARNIRARWPVALLAAFGIALVVAVVAVLMAMSQGFRAALRGTGRLDNAMVTSRGSNSEGMLRRWYLLPSALLPWQSVRSNSCSSLFADRRTCLLQVVDVRPFKKAFGYSRASLLPFAASTPARRPWRAVTSTRSFKSFVGETPVPRSTGSSIG